MDIVKIDVEEQESVIDLANEVIKLLEESIAAECSCKVGLKRDIDNEHCQRCEMGQKFVIYMLKAVVATKDEAKIMQVITKVLFKD